MPEDEAWAEARSLFGTIEDVELIDPSYRESDCCSGCSTSAAFAYFLCRILHAQCSCSRDAVAGMLASFEPKDRADMVENDKVVVTCEFCSSVYEFTPEEAGAHNLGGIGSPGRICLKANSGSRLTGLSSENDGMSISNGSPSSLTIW